MIINTQPQSRFLAQKDLPAPIVVTMDRVTEDKSLRNSSVLHFTGNTPKPFPLNLGNRRAIVSAYGANSEQWHGKQIELYVDSEVTNAKGEVTGGIRIRIPAAKPTPPVPPVLPPPAPVDSPDILKKHKMITDGYLAARTEERIGEWARYAGQFDFPAHMVDEQSDAYHDAQDRVKRTASLRQPVRA